MLAWRPDMNPSCGKVMSPLVRPTTVSSLKSKTSPCCPPSITRCRRPLGAACGDAITMVRATVSTAPQLAQNELPGLFAELHLGQATVPAAGEAKGCTASARGGAAGGIAGGTGGGIAGDIGGGIAGFCSL